MRLAVFRSAPSFVMPILLMVGAPVSAARAQEPRRLIRPDSVSLDLVAALVSSSFGGEPQILPGAMPEWIANRVPLPPGARVLGSAFLGTTVISVISVISVASTSHSVLADFRRGLRAHGWTEPPPPPSYGGFRPAPTPQFASPVTRLTLCGDQQILTASSGRQLGEATNIIVRVGSSAGNNACHPVVFQAQTNRPALPTLYNPPGPPPDPRAFADCSPAFNTSNGSGTILRSSMSPEALLDHYGRQLQDSGWAPAGVKGSEVGRTWTRRDSAGAVQEAFISVMTVGRDSTCRNLYIQLRTPRGP